MRNRDFSSVGATLGRYRVTGPVVLLGVGRRFAVSSHLAVNLEGQGTAAWAGVPVEGGRVRALNLALHMLAGVGYLF